MQLLLRDRKREASLDIILTCNTFKEALKLCKSISGLGDKQICGHLDIDPAQWSRIWTTESGHFPENKIMKFMELCENIVPLIWLAHKCGYIIQPLKTELELENEKLLSELNEEKKKLAVITEFYRSIGGKQ